MANNNEYEYNTNYENSNKNNKTKNNKKLNANLARRNEQDMNTLLEICELMDEQDLLAELVGNPLFRNEKTELLTISRLSRMENDDRLVAYGKTFQKIKIRLQQEENRIRREVAEQERAEMNAEYNRGLQLNTTRATLRNTLKAKKAQNQKSYANSQGVPQNIKRILQQGKYAKAENTKRAKNFMNAQQKTHNNLTKRLAKYNEVESSLQNRQFSLENYQRMLREIE
jgi:hypothetical protein